MRLASEMKNLSEEIVASFKNRIKENEELVIEVQKTLDGFQKDHQEITTALRASLDKGERQRLKESDILMKKIAKDHKEMATALRSCLDNDEKIRLKEFVLLMNNINNEIKSINEEVLSIFKNTGDMLEKFENEHLEMSAELRAELSKNLAERVEYTRTLLNGFRERLSEISNENQLMGQKLKKGIANGEAERLDEYKGIMNGINMAIKEIREEVKDIQKATAGMLGDFAQDRGEASAEWNKMQGGITQLREKGVVAPPKEVVKKVEKKESKKEIPVQKVRETPVKAEPEPVVPMTLEEKILDYISKHPKGVKISEMEEPLGETRMKLGFTAKNLLDNGRVLKVENIYYPKPKL